MEMEKLFRENIREMQPYSCARDEYGGKQAIFLDANENPFETGYNRYPDPNQWELKTKISRLKGIGIGNILLGNGSDEVIDLLIRSVCEPGCDNIIVFSPGYSMYEVSAAVNHVEVRKIDLTGEFLPDWERMWENTDQNSKIVFLCTPNNPTGKTIPLGQMEKVAGQFEGIVLIDEAYIDFADGGSAIELLKRYSNIVVLQTLSKAWGMAGLRLGMCFADKCLIEVLNKVKAPYNIGGLTQSIVLKELRQYARFEKQVADIKSERERMTRELRLLPCLEQVYDSEANFILVTSPCFRRIYDELIRRGIVVRIRHIPPLIPGGLRITIGRREENENLLKVLRDINVKNDWK